MMLNLAMYDLIIDIYICRSKTYSKLEVNDSDGMKEIRSARHMRTLYPVQVDSRENVTSRFCLSFPHGQPSASPKLTTVGLHWLRLDWRQEGDNQQSVTLPVSQSSQATCGAATQGSLAITLQPVCVSHLSVVAVARIMNHWDWLWMGILETRSFWILSSKTGHWSYVKHDRPLFLLKAPRLCFVNKMLTRTSGSGLWSIIIRADTLKQRPLTSDLSPAPSLVTSLPWC